MSYTSNFNLNWRVSYLESILSSGLPNTPSSTVFPFTAHTNSQAPPLANGQIEWNNVTQASATQLFVSHQDSDGDDIQVLLSALPIGSIILIQDQSTGSLYQKWQISSVTQVINQYITFGVTLIVSTHSFSNNDDILFITVSANQNLEQVLAVGNSAGAFSINLNNNNITNGNTITATSFNGLATSASSIGLTENNTTNANFFIPFAPTGAGTRALSIDSLTGPLTYNPVSSTLTASIFNGTATQSNTTEIETSITNGNFNIPFVSNDGYQKLKIDEEFNITYNPFTNTLNVPNINGTATSATNSTNAERILITPDNSAGTYYLPFVKTSGTGNKLAFIDDTSGPLTYDPSTSTLTATNFVGNVTGTTSTATNANNVLVTSDNSAGTYYIPFVKLSGTGNKPLFIDDTTGPLFFNPQTGQGPQLSLGLNFSGQGGQVFVRGPVGNVGLRAISDGGATTGGFEAVGKSTVGQYNPAVQLNDAVAVGTGGTISTTTFTLTTSSTTNSAVRISPTSVSVGAGGITATPTTSINCDGNLNNIVMNTNNITRLAINQTGELVYNYWNVGNPFYFDDFTALSESGPFFWDYTNASSRLAIFSGTYASAIRSVGVKRLGVLQLFTDGGLGADDTYAQQSVGSFTASNIKSIQFGFIPLGNGSLSALSGINVGEIRQGFGFATGGLNANDTQVGIQWRLNSATATIPDWQLMEGTTVRATLTGTNLTGGLTNKWCRATIEILSSTTYRGVFTNLTDGAVFTTSTFTINDTGSGLTNELMGRIYFHNGQPNATSSRRIAFDYCLVQTNCQPLNVLVTPDENRTR